MTSGVRCLHRVPSRTVPLFGFSAHLDEGYGDAGEESSDQQEEFSSIDVAERPDQRS